MSPYVKVIVDGVGCDAEDVPAIEEIIRCRHSTLDHLTRRELIDLARLAYEIIQSERGEHAEI